MTNTTTSIMTTSMTPDVTIDLTALVANYTAMTQSARAPGAPVVKCDAYGLGAAMIARTLEEKAGAPAFFVAYPDEGRALREVISAAPIYVFHGVSAQSLGLYRSRALTPVLNTADDARLWASAAPGVPAALHIDTGMNRLGLPPAEAGAIAAIPGLNISLVLSHFAISEQPQAAFNRAQAARFHAVAAEHFPGAARSLAASAAALTNGTAGLDDGLDLVRLGVGLYGVDPLDHPDPRIQPVATLTAEVLQTNTVPAGESVGYSRAWIARRPTQTATLAVGYGDGLPRSGSNGACAFLGGVACPIIGRISMDLTIVDITDAADPVRRGDRAEIFGRHLSINAQAAACGTIGYELLTGLGPRVVRRYLWDGAPVR